MHLEVPYSGDFFSSPRTARKTVPETALVASRLASRFSRKSHDERLYQPHSWEIPTQPPRWGPLPSGLRESMSRWPEESHRSINI